MNYQKPIWEREETRLDFMHPDERAVSIAADYFQVSEAELEGYEYEDKFETDNY